MEIILIGSLLLSLTHSILFWNKTLGVSAVIFIIPLLVLLVYVLNKKEKIKNKEGLILLLPIVLLASTYFAFYNLLFRLLNIIAIAVLIAIMCVWITKEKMEIVNLISKILNVLFAPIKYFGKITEEIRAKISKNKEKSKAENIIKSILIALPIVIIVFYLLVSADLVFASTFQGLTDYIQKLFQTEELLSLILRIITIILIFLYFASFCYNITEENTSYNEETNKASKKLEISSATINAVLTMLNIIYLIFSIIQFTHFFTQAGVSENFNYAEYARQGFSQLMFVSLINFAVIFTSQINAKSVTEGQKKYTKIMSIAIAIFTGIIIISAFMRMNLYEIEYGYTYLRLFVYAILITEFILLIPIILKLLGQKINLLKTTIIVITAMYVTLNFINIDSLIARKNINRYLENPEKELDFYYLESSTGIDAIPDIVKLLDVQDENLKEDVTRYLKSAKTQINLQHRTWQEYNLAEANAKKLLNNIEELK